MVDKKLWLRQETKVGEHRAMIAPKIAKTLIDEGFEIIVEKDPQRIFDDKDYEDVGCKLVEGDAWRKAPLEYPIVGLKELPENDSSPLPHTHVMFAHCYKQQGGWKDVLVRWVDGKGLLYDLEFLEDENGRRVAAFGYHAGFAGAAVGILSLAKQLDGNQRLGSLDAYNTEADLIKDVSEAVKFSESKLGRPIRALVIGALGRCGRGAVDLLTKSGVDRENILPWDINETRTPGPYKEIIDSDLFVNCIYLNAKIPHFVDKEFIQQAGPSRALRCVVDVSCDTTNPNNPIPIYSVNSTLEKPTVDVEGVDPPLTVVSIDHLPTLLPREASEAFSENLLPSLRSLPDALAARTSRNAAPLTSKDQVPKTPTRVWDDAEVLFWSKVADMQKAD